MTGTLAQLNVSDGGMPKFPVPAAMVTREGVAGDWQKNRKYHGGPDRAVCLFSEELYAWLRGKGIDLVSGAVGENFTTRGIDLLKLAKGDRLRVGDGCVVQITDVRVPCASLKKWDAGLPKLIVGKSGWMARVLVEGEVKAGNAIRRVERSGRSVPQVIEELVHAANGIGHGPMIRAADAAMDWRKVHDVAAALAGWLAERARRRADEFVDARDRLDLGRRPALVGSVEQFLRHCPAVGRIFQLDRRSVDVHSGVTQKERWAIEDYVLDSFKPAVKA